MEQSSNLSFQLLLPFWSNLQPQDPGVNFVTSVSMAQRRYMDGTILINSNGT